MNPSPANHQSTECTSVEAFYAERKRNEVLAKQQCEQLDWDIAQLKASTAAALAAIENEQATADRQRKQAAHLDRLRAEAEERCSSAGATAQKLDERLSNMMAHDRTADEAAFKRQRRIAEATAHLDGLQAKIEKNSEALEVLNKSVEQTRTERSALRSQLVRSAAENAAVLLQFEKLDARRIEADTNAQARRIDVAAKAASIAEHTQRLATVREKLLAQQARHASATDALRQHSEQHAERAGRIRQLNDSEDQLQREYEQLISEHMKKVLVNETTLKQRQAEIAMMTGGDSAGEDVVPLTAAEIDSVEKVCAYWREAKSASR